MAAGGHTSVVIDRLGYDGSDHPPGLSTCLGAQADMARQVVAQLRERGFRRVVLAGHSVGAVAAEVAAHQFDDLGIDALVVFALANRGYTRPALQESFVQGAVCTAGGEESEPGGPGGYAFYGQTPETWRPLVFHSAAPAVADAATAKRNRDPCGDVASLTPATALNNARQSEIAVPVLLLWGGRDAVYEPGTAEEEASAFSGSDDVTLRTFADAGHALLLEREAPDVTATLDAWLTRRGLRGTAPAADPTPPAAPSPAARRARPPVSLPVQRRCIRGRRLGLRIHRDPRPVALAVAVDGRTVLRLRGRRLERRVGGKVRVGLPRRRGPVAVTVRVRLADGDGWTATRRYRRCGGSAPPTR
jgi:pimeloyl-ACP methyl ester carboxylesterase